MLDSLYHFAGNDTVDKNSIQDGYKTPDQSPFFPVACEGSKVLGPQLNDARGHQESSSLQTGVYVCVCVCVCVRACVRACACACVCVVSGDIIEHIASAS